MNRKHLPLVVSLLALLLLACLCPLSSATLPGAQATALAQTATALAHVAQPASTLAVGAKSPTPVPTAAKSEAPVTLTSSPTSTPPLPTPTAAQTETATPEPPLPPIADVCKLLDTKLAGALLGDKMVKTQASAQKGSWATCFTVNASASTGATLAVAQDKTAVDLHVNGYAMIEAVKACAMPVPVSAEALKKQHDALDQLGLTGIKLVREAYTRGYRLIQDKGCTDPYGVQVIAGLGDAAHADHIWGYEELGTVYRNTVVYITAYKQGITAQQAADIEQKLLTPVMQQLQSQ